ncbi:hypothetical protein HPG69_007755 [Diceros bicornis minor]|uniref:RNA 3'-terminal phosphate cyclase insert domain-containing protein n=1 Tax=Diceros bicornis minor TaxID=77932 RepID=A0A7J7EAC4_DICBM|nr:hypothetical protein HPG69_007755 [Diceros bicornis minor]
MANRIVDSARSILNKFIPDIYIYTDHMKGVNSGNAVVTSNAFRTESIMKCPVLGSFGSVFRNQSPGFGLSLVAETTNGTFLSAELASNPQGQGTAVLPEDLGRNCARLLLEEIYRGGCVDSTNQSLALLLMTLGQQDVSKVLLGPLSPYTCGIKDFLSKVVGYELAGKMKKEAKFTFVWLQGLYNLFKSAAPVELVKM